MVMSLRLHVLPPDTLSRQTPCAPTYARSARVAAAWRSLAMRPFCTTDFQILRSGVVSSFPEGIIVACCACHLDKAEFGVRLIEIRLRSSGQRRRDAAFHSPVA